MLINNNRKYKGTRNEIKLKPGGFPFHSASSHVPMPLCFPRPPSASIARKPLPLRPEPRAIEGDDEEELTAESTTVVGKATSDVEVGGKIGTSPDQNPRNPNQPRQREGVRATMADGGCADDGDNEEQSWPDRSS